MITICITFMNDQSNTWTEFQIMMKKCWLIVYRFTFHSHGLGYWRHSLWRQLRYSFGSPCLLPSHARNIIACDGRRRGDPNVALLWQRVLVFAVSSKGPGRLSVTIGMYTFSYFQFFGVGLTTPIAFLPAKCNPSPTHQQQTCMSRSATHQQQTCMSLFLKMTFPVSQ